MSSDIKKFMRVKRPNMRTQKGCVSAFNKTNKSGTKKRRKKDINGIDFFSRVNGFLII